MLSLLALLVTLAMLAFGSLILVAGLAWLVTAVVFYVDDQTHPRSSVIPE